MDARNFPNVPSPKSLLFVEQALNNWLKPELTAEKFDHVGLHIESCSRYNTSKQSKMISTIFLCNDLTSNVLDEAIEEKADLIISYHPLVFGKFTPSTYNSNYSRLGVETATRCYNHNISLYSPHTALDSVPGGINDTFVWGIRGSHTEIKPANPIANQKQFNGVSMKCTIDEARAIMQYVTQSKDASAMILLGFEISLNANADAVTPSKVEFSNVYSSTLASNLGIRIYSDNDSKLEEIERNLLKIDSNITRSRFSRISPFVPGSGRILHFEPPIPFTELVDRTKRILNLKHVQVYCSGKEEIDSIAFAAGSGGYFIKDADVDVIITGEICHTNVLECIQKRKSLIVCGHTESERYFLPRLAITLKCLVNCPRIIISKEDKSPFELM